jgi:hypothetical protein
MMLDELTLNLLGTLFENLAESYQGEFDGWKSEVIKDERIPNKRGPSA